MKHVGSLALLIKLLAILGSNPGFSHAVHKQHISIYLVDSLEHVQLISLFVSTWKILTSWKEKYFA